ncbi:YbgC/FadM family acyl-CoA thioesterase, partial [Rivihabitans pingtungensis]
MHHTPIKVRGYHLDLYGHVNNARYLEFLEEARWAYFEATHGLEWFTESGLAFVVVNININYRRPAFMNEQLVVHTGVKSLSNRSAVIHQRITLDDMSTVVSEADITFVLFDEKQNKAIV